MIKQIDWQGVPAYVLENDRLAVSICPSRNNNAYRIWDKTMNRELLRTPSGPGALLEEPIQYGTPILMPPNRIRKGQFSYGGRSYQFDVNHATGNHIHGMLRTQPWQVVSEREDADGASLTSRVRFADYPEVQRQYPHDLELEVTYTLQGGSLVQRTRATNHGSDPAPFGFGLHTWFLLDGEPEAWSLQVPVSGVWELDEANLPVGHIAPLGRYEALVQGDRLAGYNMDTVFQNGEGVQPLAVLSRGGYELRYSASREFKQWVIFTKGEAHDFICLEPYTWVTDAPNINQPAEVTGLRAIAPGETLELTVTLDVVHP